MLIGVTLTHLRGDFPRLASPRHYFLRPPSPSTHHLRALGHHCLSHAGFRLALKVENSRYILSLSAALIDLDWLQSASNITTSIPSAGSALSSSPGSPSLLTSAGNWGWSGWDLCISFSSWAVRCLLFPV